MKLSDDELRTLVGERVSQSLAGGNAELNLKRERALNFYYGRPLGNEIAGRSQIVSKDMMDTIEWLMPSLMRVFTTKQAVQFDPEGPEDEEAAKQETAYVSHVLWKQNDGFMLIYTWLKDALMQNVGYVKYWWEDEEKVTYQEYSGLTQDQAAFTLQELESQGEIDIVGAEISHTAPGMPQTIDFKVKLVKKKGRLRVAPVPPEEAIVSSDRKGGIKLAKLGGHIRTITRSELMEMGYTRAQVEEVTDYTAAANNVSQARSVDGDAQKVDEGVDWATKEMTLLECYTTIDADDDGIAELRHFLMHGAGFLENEEADEIQMESWTPIPTPHQHAGLSIYDLTEDDQRINTGLTRSLLDNAYFGNNRRLAYNKNTVNVHMLQINRPGGHIAVDGPPMGEIWEVPVTDIGSRLLPIIQYFHQVRQRRTGVGDMNSGVDADVLAQATKGAYMDAKGAANQRIEAICRIFAETGFARLYASMHKMLCKHQDWPTKFKLKDDWVTVNPTEWQERANLTVSVGLGTASRDEVRSNLAQMASAQTAASQMPGIVQPQNVYALAKRMQVELGFENEAFFTDPASDEYKAWAAKQGQTAPDPYLEAEKLKQQTKLKEIASDAQQQTLDRAQERDLTITTLEVKSGVDLAKAGIGAEVAVARGNRPPGPGGPGAADQQPVQRGNGSPA